MADITMCDAVNSLGICLMRNGCHRYTAPAGVVGQSYFVVAPFKIVPGPAEAAQECDNFWPNERI